MRSFARSGLVFEALLFRPAAAADLEEAALWYEAQRPGLGREFLDAAEDAAKRVVATPEGYAVVYKDRRRALLQRFPYSLVYRLVHRQVVVVAVVHAKRKPSVWRSRE
jgi:plasmid stabilization system protein ParE